MLNRFDLFDFVLMAAGFLLPLAFFKIETGLFTLNVVDVITFFMAVGFGLRARREKLSLTLSGTDKLFLILLFWTAASITRTIEPAKTWHEFILMVESALIYYFVGHGIRGDEKVPRLLRIWCYGAVITAALGLVQYYYMAGNGTGMIRINSTLPHPNSLSGYLVLFIPVMMAFGYEGKKPDRYFWGILTAITITALVFTYTRGGWAATGIALLALIALLKDKRTFAVLIAAILLYGMVFPGVVNRTASAFRPGVDGSSSQRLQLWKVGIKMWQVNPINGVGLGNYFHLHNQYLIRYPELGNIYESLEPHNSFIKFLAETGLVGFSIFIAIIGTLVGQLLKLCRGLYTRKKNLLQGIACGGMAFILQSNTNSLFHDTRVAICFWLVAGLVTAVYRSVEAADPLISLAVHPGDAHAPKMG